MSDPKHQILPGIWLARRDGWMRAAFVNQARKGIKPTSILSDLGERSPPPAPDERIILRATLHIDDAKIEVVRAPAPQAEVPHFWELLLTLVIPPERQSERIGCFEERFHTWSKKFGPRRAQFIYAWHVVRSVCAIAAARIRSVSDGDT